MKIKKGDTVKIISGKDNGKEGKVLQVIPRKKLVLIEGVNIAKKHQKPQGQTMQGGVIDKSMPIDISNVALVVKKKSGRVSYRLIKMEISLESLLKQETKHDTKTERKI